MSVYVITDRGANVCKIGFSSFPLKRLLMLRTSTHADLSLEAVIPACMANEKEIHRHFYFSHIRREWFAICKEIESLIASFPPEISERPKSQLGDLTLHADHFIDALGGTTPVARLLKTNVSTVHSWRRVGISESRFHHMELAAKASGVDWDAIVAAWEVAAGNSVKVASA